MEKLIELMNQLMTDSDGGAFSDGVFDLTKEVAGDNYVPAQGRAVVAAQMLGSLPASNIAQIGIAMGVRALRLLQAAKDNPEVKREADIHSNTLPSIH